MRKKAVAAPPGLSSYTNGNNTKPVSSPLLAPSENDQADHTTDAGQCAAVVGPYLTVPHDNNNNDSDSNGSRRISDISINYSCDPVTAHQRKSKQKTSRGQQTHRATLMLLVVVITFVIAEFPISLLLLLR